MKKFRSMTYPYVVWIGIMIVVPMLLIMLYAFTVDGNDVSSFKFSVYATKPIVIHHHLFNHPLY